MKRITLNTLLREHYLPEHPYMGDGRWRRFVNAVNSLERFAGCEIAVADLTQTLFDAFHEYRLRHNSTKRADDTRAKIRQLWAFAVSKGFCDPMPKEVERRPANKVYDEMDDAAGGLTMRQMLWTKYYPMRRSIKRASVEQIDWILRAFYRFHGRAILAAELCDDLALPFIAHVCETKSDETAKRTSTSIMGQWKFAYRKSFTETPLPRDYDPPRVKRRIPRAWTLPEFAKLLQAAAKKKRHVADIPAAQWWTSLLMFLYDSGGRVGAVLQVRTSDIDMDRRQALLRADASKTGVDQIVDFSAETEALIRQHVDVRRERIWPWPFDRRELWIHHKWLCRDAGLDCGKGVGFHRIRKMTATQTVIAIGWDQARVALGHSAEAMTRRYVDIRQVPRPQFSLPSPLGFMGVPLLGLNVTDSNVIEGEVVR